MSVSLRLKIKKEFREPLRSKIGFVGREAELARLTSLFQHRTAATVLVSGHRGVGKSALVDEALARSIAGKTKRTVARLTLPHIYPADDGSVLRGQILRALARSLYFAMKDDDSLSKALRERAEALYSKTYLTELKEHTAVESLAEAEAKSQSSIKTETTIAPSKLVSGILGSALAGGVAVGGVAVVNRVSQDHGIAAGVIAALAVVGAAVASAITIGKSREDVASISDKITKRDEVTRTGTLDLSPETLEFELRDLVKQLHDDGRPCVFVIDELDKLEVGPKADGDLEQHVIFKIVASLKNFFTLGAGVFIFISGEDFSARLGESIASGGYALAHTLFTDRIFVHALHYSDVERLTDQLLAQKPSDEKLYRQFRNYLCWESRNHVFDLLSLIGEYVEFDSKEGPVLLAQESGEVDGRWREGNLPGGWQVAAGLQKFAGSSYDESHRPTAREERFNQAIWLTLLDAARTLFDGESLDVPEDGYETPDEPWLAGLSDRDLDDLSGAVERLLAKMERYGAVSVVQATRTVEAEGGNQEQQVTRYELVDEPPYPPTSVGREAELIPVEKSYLELSERIERLVTNSGDAGVESGGFAEEIRAVRELSKQVGNTSPRSTVPRSRVREGFKRADALARNLIQTGVRGVVESWASSKGAQLSSSIAETETRTGQPWQSSMTEFTDLATHLSDGSPEYFIMGGATSDNQVLVINDWGDRDLGPISDAYSKALTGEKGRDRRKQRLPIVVVSHAGSDDSTPMPKEVIDIIKEIEGPSFLRWLFGGEVKRERKVVDLAGWNVFSLQSDLGNLKDLGTFIDGVAYVNP